MKESPLMTKSKAFALDVIKVRKELRVAKCGSALINQFLRSGTSKHNITCPFGHMYSVALPCSEKFRNGIY